MGYNCDCIYNRNISDCTNKNVKHSFFGYGPRKCDYLFNPIDCKYSKSHRSIKPPPAPPKKYNKCCCHEK